MDPLNYNFSFFQQPEINSAQQNHFQKLPEEIIFNIFSYFKYKDTATHKKFRLVSKDFNEHYLKFAINILQTGRNHVTIPGMATIEQLAAVLEKYGQKLSTLTLDEQGISLFKLSKISPLIPSLKHLIVNTEFQEDVFSTTTQMPPFVHSLKNLTLCNLRKDVFHLSQFKPFDHLEELTFDNCSFERITYRDPRNNSFLSNDKIKKLSFYGGDSLKNFNFLKYFIELETFFFDDLCDASEKLLPSLGSLTTLRSIKLTQANIAEDDLRPLSGLVNLTSLFLESEDEDNSISIAPLSNLTNLTDLTISSLQFEEDFEEISSLVNLTKLGLPITDQSDFSPLQHLTNLTSLNLHTTPVSDLAPFYSLPYLSSLNLGNTACLEEDVYRFLSVNPNINKINFSNKLGEEIIKIRLFNRKEINYCLSLHYPSHEQAAEEAIIEEIEEGANLKRPYPFDNNDKDDNKRRRL